ncbi:hypothetical protein H6F89_15480 [Cyanobacteria bacterium FACHB-63]|nr:hypothetical protein [Cyanobacteria bacterium FACHB-63]
MRYAVLGAVAIGALAYAVPASALTTTFNYTGNIQTYSVNTTGVYTINAYGAQGGTGFVGVDGGGGGRASADVNLTAGQVLRILVGGRGGDGSNSGGGGGGGGTFVTIGTGGAIPIVVAGGGGGGGFDGFGDFGSGGGAGSFGTGAGAGGDFDGAGGGFSTNGGGARSGAGFINGGGGGTGSGGAGSGGFGGGGGGGFGGGGGGGFDGGNGTSNFGGGGGTGFINNDVAFSPTNIVTGSGVRTGNGLVEITAPAATPVPFAFSPLPGLVAGGVLSRLKRRKQSQRDVNSPVKAC